MSAKYQIKHDALFKAFVKTTADGRTAVYVWGVLGRGFIVAPPDLERLTRISRFFGIAICIALIAGAFLFGWTGAAAAFVLVIAANNLAIRHAVQGLERTTDKLTIVQVYRVFAREYPPWLAVLGSAGAVLMIAAGICLLWTLGTATAVVALPMTVFGIGILALFVFWLILRR